MSLDSSKEPNSFVIIEELASHHIAIVFGVIQPTKASCYLLHPSVRFLNFDILVLS